MGFLNRRNFLKSTTLLGFSTFFLPKLYSNDFKNYPENFLIKPKKLQIGDKIAITAPGGAIWDPELILRFELLLQKMGYSVVLGGTLTKKYGYLAGTDEERVDELKAFFLDSTINGIIAMRGGWGCARMLDKIDYSIIRSNPKLIMGFSDVSSLLNAIFIKAGLVTFHGLVGVNSWNQFSTNVFNNVVCSTDNYSFPLDEILRKDFITINDGIAQGKLIGGNLSVISGIVGSAYFDLPEDTILFLEETNEEPYVVDRLLTHLKIAGVYKNVKGIIFGSCTKCLAEKPLESMLVIDVIKEHFSDLKIPVSYGSPIGHEASKWTLPIGVKVEMNAGNGSLKLLESAVI